MHEWILDTSTTGTQFPEEIPLVECARRLRSNLKRELCVVWRSLLERLDQLLTRPERDFSILKTGSGRGQLMVD